jgi:folate-dependent tRNA-U54 methylase TrmFO/GidA
MRVKGLDNLFIDGKKSGLFVGHTEAICIGSLAGHNAARHLIGMPMLILTKTTTIGDLIAYANEMMKAKKEKGQIHFCWYKLL